MRTQTWLENKLDSIWQLLFPEVPKENNVLIKFKGKPKLRFGFIKKKDKDTLIVVNSLFKSELVPEYVVDITIAHELVHYSHGFHSPLPKQYKYPHQGNIVNKELRKRGFAFQLAQEKKWVKNSWFKIYKELIN
ncbi:MAG: hypothetical protein KKG75_02110 [Nanoarchaeota archaeon]|nr:hypothetical protein [Nanoarchaeota archaeon]